jgi:hypothetical protein
MNPISVFLNKVPKFYPTDFKSFVTGFKKEHNKIIVNESSDNGMIYGYYKGDVDAQFKYDPDDMVLHTDLPASKVWSIVRRGSK